MLQFVFHQDIKKRHDDVLEKVGVEKNMTLILIVRDKGRGMCWTKNNFISKGALKSFLLSGTTVQPKWFLSSSCPAEHGNDL